MPLAFQEQFSENAKITTREKSHGKNATRESTKVYGYMQSCFNILHLCNYHHFQIILLTSMSRKGQMAFAAGTAYGMLTGKILPFVLRGRYGICVIYLRPNFRWFMPGIMRVFSPTSLALTWKEVLMLSNAYTNTLSEKGNDGNTQTFSHSLKK